MWHFLNADLNGKSVLVLNPQHAIGEEIASALRNAGANVHLHSAIPQPDCNTLILHPSGRHDVAIICYDAPHIHAKILSDYAHAYAPHLQDVSGTLLFVLLHEACAFSDDAPDSHPVRTFASQIARDAGRETVRINVIAPRARDASPPQTKPSRRKRNTPQTSTESAAIEPTNFAEVVLFLTSPLNTYISGVAFTADV